MNMKRTLLGAEVPKRTESVLCAIIALAIVGTVTSDNWPGDMRLESDAYIGVASALSTKEETSTTITGAVFFSNGFDVVTNDSGIVHLTHGSDWFDFVSDVRNEREKPKDATAYIKTLVELDDTRLTLIHARLALSAMEYAIRSGREGEFVGILGDFLAKGLKEEGAK